MQPSLSSLPRVRGFLSKLALASIAFGAVNSAHAGLINFDTCFARCDAADAQFGDDLGILATLEYTDNGNGGVLFVLTHTFSNSYNPAEGTYLSELFLNFDTVPSGITGQTNNISSITIDEGNVINAGLGFDVDTDLKDSARRRLLDGQTASWTFLGITEADVVGTALVHIRDLPDLNPQNPQAGDRIKLTGTPTIVQQVPEPAGIALLGAGMLMLRRRFKRSA